MIWRGERRIFGRQGRHPASLLHQAVASSCGSAIGASPRGMQWVPRTRIPPQAKGGSSWPRPGARLRATFELCGGLAVTHLEAPYQHGAWVSLRKGRGTRVGNGVIPARQLGGIWLQSQMARGGPERTGRAEIAFQGAGPGRGRGSSTPSGWSRTPTVAQSLGGGHRCLWLKIVLPPPRARFNPSRLAASWLCGAAQGIWLCVSACRAAASSGPAALPRRDAAPLPPRAGFISNYRGVGFVSRAFIQAALVRCVSGVPPVPSCSPS